MIREMRKRVILSPVKPEPEKKKEVPKKKKQETSKVLPSDVYPDEFPPTEIVLSDTKKIVVSVKRGGDLGLPLCDLRIFVDKPEYTGFTKKGLNFPIEHLNEVINVLEETYEKCAAHKLFDGLDEPETL